MADHVQYGRDRRQSQRSRVYWGGEVSFNDYFEPYACVVREFSIDGARLSLENNVRLPEIFKVWVASRQMHVRARKIWHKGQSSGIKFEGFEPARTVRTMPKVEIPRAALRPA